MQVAIPWLFVMVTFFTGAWVIFLGLLDVSSEQGENLRQAHERQVERINTQVSIAGTEVSLSAGRCGTLQVDTLVVNSGDVPIVDFSRVDLLLSYINNGSRTSVRLTYVSEAPLAGQWTVQSITPDNSNVNVLDPKERATFRLRPDPLPQTGSVGTVLIATPQGTTDSAYVEFDYARSNDCRFLHNNPTPPTGDTDSQADLSMDEIAPTAVTLYNFDQDGDANPGRTITKGSVGAGETDLGKYQNWRTGVLAEPLTLSGTVAVDLWSAISGYALNKDGILTIFFRDYDGLTYTEIGQGTFYDIDWQAGVSDFVRKAILIPDFDYTVPVGNQLEIKIIVGAIASPAMWFAYDTDTYESLVNLSYVEPSFSTLFYMHNNPTAPTGDTDTQSPLAMNTTIPTATTLYNYDQDLDSDAGRRLLKTTKGLTETNLSKHQAWRTGALGSDLMIDGDVKLDLWASSIDFAQGKREAVTAYLRDFNGSTYTEIAHDSVYAEDWQDGSGAWVQGAIFIPEVSYMVLAGNELELFMVLENNAQSGIWLAYDTADYPMVLKIP